MAIRRGEQELFAKTRPRSYKGSSWPRKRARHAWRKSVRGKGVKL